MEIILPFTFYLLLFLIELIVKVQRMRMMDVCAVHAI